MKYEEALEAANGIVADNSNKTQAEVDAAKDALKAAKEALVKAPVDPQLDKSKLQAAVDAAKAKDENAYTTASYNAMEKVLAEAEELLTNGKDQAAIDAKAKDLNDAVAALVERGNTDASERGRLHNRFLESVHRCVDSGRKSCERQQQS